MRFIKMIIGFYITKYLIHVGSNLFAGSSTYKQNFKHEIIKALNENPYIVMKAKDSNELELWEIRIS